MSVQLSTSLPPKASKDNLLDMVESAFPLKQTGTTLLRQPMTLLLTAPAISTLDPFLTTVQYGTSH